MEIIRRFVREEQGQGLVEYALIIGLIAVVAIAALTASGGSISSIFGTISGKLSNANATVS
ncbi:MAG: Flp family type IVb pilin [Candidatus Riflebacteria bacterium]|nr:Flp family type IVb pilin [Candidatus Riflebacteria bacterium]MBF0499916.1 Flp family type IVb pilin [Candidatus Riflebacteria bacterium]